MMSKRRKIMLSRSVSKRVNLGSLKILISKDLEATIRFSSSSNAVKVYESMVAWYINF